MIRINFIEQEISQEINRQTRKMSLLFYLGLWIISLLFLWIIFIGNQRELHSFARELVKVQENIFHSRPQLMDAISLYKKREKLEKNLSSFLNKTVESQFIVENLRGLTNAIPDNLWITEFRIFNNEFEKPKQGTPKTGKIEKVGISTRVKANILLNLEDENATQLNDFQYAVHQQIPFHDAESELVLDYIKLHRDSTAYYHDFEIEFRWSEKRALNAKGQTRYAVDFKY
ncbi:MAG: hypothetical protein DWQ05_18825 [Calditrichaeota bacterium]|nr:MAG: hypothetical protein DWQ05_18825 [Calditrichota bacterium]